MIFVLSLNLKLIEDKGRKGKLKSRAKDINPFTFGEQHNNAMFIKK